MMKQAKEPAPEPLPGLWRVAQGKGAPTERPRNKPHKPPRNNSSSRKHKRKPPTSRVSKPLSGHSLLAWTLADIRSSDNAGREILESKGLTMNRSQLPNHEET